MIRLELVWVWSERFGSGSGPKRDSTSIDKQGTSMATVSDKRMRGELTWVSDIREQCKVPEVLA